MCYAAADFFQNVSGDPTNTASVFLTSTYGPLADKWQSNIGLYNYALFFIGSQPAGAGTPFVPQEALTTAVDWSPFSPHAATPGGLDVATGWGPTQYGCCPKTVADPPSLPVRQSNSISSAPFVPLPGCVRARYDQLDLVKANTAELSAGGRRWSVSACNARLAAEWLLLPWLRHTRWA